MQPDRYFLMCVQTLKPHLLSLRERKTMYIYWSNIRQKLVCQSLWTALKVFRPGIWEIGIQVWQRTTTRGYYCRQVILLVLVEVLHWILLSSIYRSRIDLISRLISPSLMMVSYGSFDKKYKGKNFNIPNWTIQYFRQFNFCSSNEQKRICWIPECFKTFTVQGYVKDERWRNNWFSYVSG